MVLLPCVLMACVALSLQSSPLSEEDLLMDEPDTGLTIDQIIMSTYASMDDAMSASQLVDNSMMAELDMNLTAEQFQSLYDQDGQNSAQHRAKRNIRDTRLRWTNGVMPYELTAGHFSARDQGLIRQAITEWNTATCLNIRPATSRDRNKVRMQNGQGCNSQLGMVGGTQILNLQAPGCRYKGLYLHELGHAIGLVHEHQLPSRDDYIYIQYQNVFQGWGIWFNKYKEQEINTHGVDYDLSSVMHYGVTAFSKDGVAKTIRTHDPAKEHLIGKVYQKGLTFADIKIVNLMYNCAAHCTDGKRCIKGGFKDKRCNCVCPPGVTSCTEGGGPTTTTTVAPPVTTDGGTPGCRDKNPRCPVWARDGWCTRSCTEWMDENCMKSCNKCSTGSVTTAPTVATTTTTASPPTTTAGTGGGEDPGCYKEGVDRDLPTRAYGDGENTRSRCRKTCREQNFQYAGVQNGVGCWCGNDFGKHGKVPDAHCHYPCSGNADETCGAWFLNYIMRTATQSSDYVHVTVPGCFTETPSRELYHREYSDGANTRERCTLACRAGGYKYAGVQNGRGCWCGNEAGGYGSLDESECDLPCSGDSDQTCGAEYKNYIMETGYTAPRS